MANWSKAESMGPVEILVVGFEGDGPNAEILDELERLRNQDAVRLIDLLVVAKNADGKLTALSSSDLGWADSPDLGAAVAALVGLEMKGETDSGFEPAAGEPEDAGGPGSQDVWFLADALPENSSAAIFLVEHRWAIPLRTAIDRAGGVEYADEWIDPADLAIVGLTVAPGPEEES
jgi:hypothetical protein